MECVLRMVVVFDLLPSLSFLKIQNLKMISNKSSAFVPSLLSTSQSNPIAKADLESFNKIFSVFGKFIE